jgi:putative FmdB family regulatory protein
LYEFQCRECGRVFEELIRNSAEEAEAACPGCKAKSVQRLLSATALGLVGVSAGGGSTGGSCGGGSSGFT